MLKPNAIRSFLSIASAFVVPSLVHAAGPAPLGAKFRASACTTCSQVSSSVAGVASGEFFVAWEGKSAADSQGVAGRMFKNNGTPKGADLQINPTALPAQHDVAVAGDATGYVAAWSQVEGVNSEVYVRRYTAAGVAVGSAVKVNNADNPASPPYADFNPVVAKTTGGAFVVVWVRFKPSGPTTAGTDPEVLLRRFNNAGGALGAPVKLNVNLVNGDRPDVCVDSTGQIDVAWTSADGFPPFEANHKGVSVRRVAPAGTTIGGEILVAAPLATSAPVGIACGTQGQFMVVWQSERPPAVTREDILGVRYTKAGVKMGNVFVVNSARPGSQRSPQVSADTAGNYVVVWQSENPPSGLGVFGRRFTSAAVATGNDFAVDTSVGTEPRSIDPDVAHLGSTKNFVVVFQDGLKGIWARRFGPGTPLASSAPDGAEDEAIAADTADDESVEP